MLGGCWETGAGFKDRLPHPKIFWKMCKQNLILCKKSQQKKTKFEKKKSFKKFFLSFNPSGINCFWMVDGGC